MGRGERLNSFLWAGFAISAVNLSVLAAFWAPFTEPGALPLGEMALMAVLNGGLSAAIGLIGYFVLGNLFDITTPLHWSNCRPTHPLLRQLLLKAPGTYHHTILVSNMAEAPQMRSARYLAGACGGLLPSTSARPYALIFSPRTLWTSPHPTKS